MDCPRDCLKFFLKRKLDDDCGPSYSICAITTDDVEQLSHYNKKLYDLFNTFITELGRASAEAQRLPHIITTADRMVHAFGEHQILYIAIGSEKSSMNNKVFGFLKTGFKSLFVRSQSGSLLEKPKCPCVLDFFTHSNCRRKGVGFNLFKTYIHHSKVRPHAVGYDRPSSNLIGFLKKYCSAGGIPVMQENSYAFLRHGLVKHLPDIKYEGIDDMSSPIPPKSNEYSSMSTLPRSAERDILISEGQKWREEVQRDKPKEKIDMHEELPTPYKKYDEVESPTYPGHPKSDGVPPSESVHSPAMQPPQLGEKPQTHTDILTLQREIDRQCVELQKKRARGRMFVGGW
ncbi:Alpha-tubulin N-acetyltransferase like protein [Aduncisulcus paluster]|uniref:Alpha-tubulin N-acetyltransferase like protein n=1 Tax=Aduncisulcus paluster TaxID=2918883 RepID=A0ABQ5JT01_9EUKA|nr:Alpha-tubulin N-acetyltransferase like protein [Aduncisulcus paluster]